MLDGRAITVLGAGIGGLAAATALAQRGARVRVLEQAAAITEVGAGLQISPNGGRVLSALGIGPVGDASGAVALMDGPTGRGVMRMVLPGGFRLVHRADLIAALERAARDAGVQIVLGARVESVTVGPPAALTYADGRAEAVDLLVGADGLHAPTRTAVLGPAKPFFTGQVAWRATVAGRGQAEVAQARVFMGAGRHLVTYPLRGGALINIVAVEERADWAAEGWNHTDDPANLRAAFAGFAPEVRSLLDQVEMANIWGLFRHPVAPHWHKGAVALLGDAAHPTLPFLAQGAVMALEDAWVLARALAEHSDTDAALAAYQALRRPRASRAIAAANANARNYHLGGLQRHVAHAGLRAMGRIAPGAMLGRFAWLYDHDVTAP
jgi:salicylate hydroxylase